MNPFIVMKSQSERSFLAGKSRRAMWHFSMTVITQKIEGCFAIVFYSWEGKK